jgi:hypothetical protein
MVAKCVEGRKSIDLKRLVLVCDCDLVMFPLPSVDQDPCRKWKQESRNFTKSRCGFAHHTIFENLSPSNENIESEHFQEILAPRTFLQNTKSAGDGN